MKIINLKLLILGACFSVGTLAETTSEMTPKTNTALIASMQKNCADIHLNAYEEDHLLLCIKLLSKGSEQALPIAYYLSAQAMYSGKNMMMNKPLSRRLFTSAAQGHDMDDINNEYRLLAKVALKILY